MILGSGWDTPSASWHPAMMPDSPERNKPAPSSSREPQSPIAPSHQDLEEPNFDSPEVHGVSAGASLSEPAKAPEFLDQFGNDEESGPDSWDFSNPTPVPPVTEQSEPQIPHDEPAPVVAAAAPAGNTAKHASTVSFARTVSHDVPFNDDEDSEWNLQRSDTNPFSFMPDIARTNSFPVVPQANNIVPDTYTSPPPASQAEEILQEVEHEEEHEDLVAQSGSFGSQQMGEMDTFRPSIGGDFASTEQDPSDTRYEEGLPLIPQQHGEDARAHQEKVPTSSNDLFSQDGHGDDVDDFFAQKLHDSDTDSDTHQGVSLKHALQRKSTTMAIAKAADSEPPSPIEEEASRDLANGKKQIAVDDGGAPKGEPNDVDAKWAAAFADDDDEEGFLLDDNTQSKELNPEDVFGSDDEGFLDDGGEEDAVMPAQIQPAQPITNGRYAPSSAQQSPYANSHPFAPALGISNGALQQRPYYASSNTAPTGRGFGVPAKPELPKAQSFVGKSKGGYQSPYDLPMDVVKPMKRSSTQQMRPNPPTLPAGPPRTNSMYSQPPPSSDSNSSFSPPNSSHSNQHAPAQKPTPQLKQKSSFFEELPMSSRVRPASRQSSTPAPPQQNPYAQLQAQPPGPPVGAPPVRPQAPPTGLAPSQMSPALAPGGVALVAPERVSPYAGLQAEAPARPQPPSSVNSRYSPAPTSGPNGAVPVANNRYSPAPISRSSSGNYSAVPPPMLAHQPRTSSPLAHFEFSSEQSGAKLGSPGFDNGAPLLRSSSSQYEHRLTRVPSLPPTQEVEEEQLPSPGAATKSQVAPPPSSQYSPSKARHTPPPMGIAPSNPLSPPKRSLSNYAPQPAVTMPPKEVSFVPPPRSQTQSPGAVYGNRGPLSPESAPRPSSAHGPAAMNTRTVRARGMSQTLNLVAPTDGRELDPLQRWRGAPCISWGVGGVFVSAFPKDMPRYGISSNIPQITRTPGEVKIKYMKDIEPLEERLAKFPGPLKGKSKKKETLAWLTAGIDGLESTLPNISFQQQVPHDDKRAVERVLLWKILRVLVENDGVLEGNPTVEKAVRDVITPGLDVDNAEPSSAVSIGMDLTGTTGAAGPMQGDAVDHTAVESIRKLLLLGDREKAVWAAADKRLWGHALLISSSVQNPELYRQVTQEFIKKEVNQVSRGNESLAALYGVLSGNFDEAVDELVPVHARAGMQLMSTSASNTSEDTLAGLDKWRETLSMVLSNRRQGDAQALRSLGNLLSGYGRAEAAHICYIFAKTFAVFGGLDDPNANFVLVGADHRRQADSFAKETEALQLSEVYEFGLSLVGGTSAGQSCPHLAAYKLQHAMVLAEHGFRDKALQYCEGIYNAITAQTKKSPYYNPALESAVDDLLKRLKLAAGDKSTSWIPNLKTDQVSSSMWSRFNKFVAGDDENGTGNGAPGESGVEAGPFARIAGGTPSISRSPSVSNFEVYGSSPAMPPPTKVPSLYAPGGAQLSSSPYEPSGAYMPQRSSMDGPSGEARRGSRDLPSRDSDTQGASLNPYSPGLYTPYQPTAPASSVGSPYMPTSQGPAASLISEQASSYGYGGYQPFGAEQKPPGESSQDHQEHEAHTNAGYQPPSHGGYEPPSNSFDAPATQPEMSSGGYDPPSFQPSSFEPPSYEPGPADGDAEENKPKKKSFMDDDDDDIPGLRPKEKTKTDKDKENEEMFRKVAEEEAKRASEQKLNKKSSGWGLSGWFGAKKETNDIAPKAIKAKLGEASSFVYDPDLKRWVNKKAGADNTPAKTATPPPPRAMSTPPPSAPTSMPPPINIAGAPSSRPPMGLSKTVSHENLGMPNFAAPPMARSVSGQSNASIGGPPSAPPSRPATSLSNASSIDDLIGAAGPRKGGKKPRKAGRYVDVMAK
ncbi:Sec23-binding domain of Sec16-domain-containing protein [Xylariaceae sp. FL1019]|nr:Sec23-binding domain of Sec16-domain-containing protein [Xylariaceae sp. FL1019]